MRPDDVAAAARSYTHTFDVLDASEGTPVHPPTEQGAARARARVAHLLLTDPDGAAVAERDGEVVGVTLALRRGPLWFLSLLTVDPGQQGAGVGARLLEHALRTSKGASVGYLCASRDPRALRRYARAGLALQPGDRAAGTVDRSALVADPGVREGDWDRDAELVDACVAAQRGVGMLDDLPVLLDAGARPLLLEGPDGRGCVVLRSNGDVMWLAAETEATAGRLLRAALAQPEGETEVEWVTARQAWAVDALLDARLPLLPGGSLALRGGLGPMAPYLPSGAYG